MRVRILGAVVALTVVLQLTGCCCWRERWCARRLYRRGDVGCCQPCCYEPGYYAGMPPPMARPTSLVLEGQAP